MTAVDRMAEFFMCFLFVVESLNFPVRRSVEIRRFSTPVLPENLGDIYINFRVKSEISSLCIHLMFRKGLTSQKINSMMLKSIWKS